mmetsp:Transcript_66569/g.159103  ORF Transcript_66569/g.159103 Transcript_66569/m.159103 type:complete len:212 (-) Transcript_66569:478-1113(-)
MDPSARCWTRALCSPGQPRAASSASTAPESGGHGRWTAFRTSPQMATLLACLPCPALDATWPRSVRDSPFISTALAPCAGRTPKPSAGKWNGSGKRLLPRSCATDRSSKASRRRLAAATSMQYSWPSRRTRFCAVASQATRWCRHLARTRSASRSPGARRPHKSGISWWPSTRSCPCRGMPLQSKAIPPWLGWRSTAPSLSARRCRSVFSC